MDVEKNICWLGSRLPREARGSGELRAFHFSRQTPKLSVNYSSLERWHYDLAQKAWNGRGLLSASLTVLGLHPVSLASFCTRQIQKKGRALYWIRGWFKFIPDAQVTNIIVPYIGAKGRNRPI